MTVGDDAGGRIDSYLAERLGLSRSRVASLIVDRCVLVDGRVAKKSDPVVAGQEIEARVPPPSPLRAEAQEIPLAIVYQDRHLVVVNKAPGLVVHPAPGHPDGTLVNALLHHVRDLSGIGGKLRPGIVHRLDRDTSGLLVVAKTDLAHRALSEALKARRVGRVYVAVLWGRLAESPVVVDRPIGRHPGDRTRMAVAEEGGARGPYPVPSLGDVGGGVLVRGRARDRADAPDSSSRRSDRPSGSRRLGLRCGAGTRVRRRRRPLGQGVG